MKKAQRFEGDEESVTVAVEIITLISYNGWSDLFKKASEVMEQETGLLMQIKPELSAQGHRLKLYLMRECIEPKPEEVNTVLLAKRLSEE